MRWRCDGGAMAVGRGQDAQLVCLEVSAHEAILDWQPAATPSSRYSTAEYDRRYLELAQTLYALASGAGPPPSQVPHPVLGRPVLCRAFFVCAVAGWLIG